MEGTVSRRSEKGHRDGGSQKGWM